MAVRADLGMVFQEGALFDSLTVRENVGYKLYEETDMPLDEVERARRGGARLRRPGRVHRPDAVGALGRAAAPRRDRPRDGRQAAHPALRRADDRARSDHARRPSTRRSSSCATSRASARSSSRTSCATRSTSPTHMAVAAGRRGADRAGDRRRRPTRPSSSCCKDGLIVFEGNADELRAAPNDPYIEAFLS